MENRAQVIIELVIENPGIRYSEVMRQTGLKNGVLSHYLTKIEQSGKIMIARTPRVARLYPCGMPEEETTIIKSLRSETSRKILLNLLGKDLTFKEIIERVKKSPGTVSIVLKNLTADEIVERKFQEGVVLFGVINKDLTGKLAEKQKPKLVESAVDNISDIFGSL